MQIDAEVSNDGSLVDGMNVRVAVRQQVADRLVVPKSAVVIRDNEEVLFRFRDGKALWTYVHTSLANSREYADAAGSSGVRSWRSKPSSRTKVRFLGLSRQSRAPEEPSLTYYANM